MSEQIRRGDPAFGRLFTEFGHTAYRFEGLPSYDVPGEKAAYARFLAGEPQVPDPALTGWLDIVTSATQVGKVMRRVRLVEEPLSPYLLFEFGRYERNVAAGEDIRILPVSFWPPPLPARDFWLFDSSELWLMEYDVQGRFLGVEHVTDPAVIVEHGYWRDAALHIAVPFSDYAAKVPQLRRAS